MNASTNISSNPKLLAKTARPVSVARPEGGATKQEHHLEPMPFCTIENVHVRAETVTSTLQGIQDYWPSER